MAHSNLRRLRIEKTSRTGSGRNLYSSERQKAASEEIVRLSIDIECSRDFVEKLLREYTLTIRSPDRERLVELSYRPKEQRGPLPFRQTQEGAPPSGPESQSRPEEQGPGWVQRAFPCLLLLILLAAGTVVGKMYLERRQMMPSKREVSTVRPFEPGNRQSAGLLQERDTLLARLDQLTSLPKMRRVFPEITSMTGVVLAKRASDPVEQSLAARECLVRVKTLFDQWVEESQDLPPYLRPNQKDISFFKSLWNETESLLGPFVEAGRALSASPAH